MQSKYKLDPANADKISPGVISRFPRKSTAANLGVSAGLIKTCFNEAIEYKGIMDGTRGVFLYLGLVCITFILWTSIDSTLFSIQWAQHWPLHIGTFLYISIALPFGIYFFLKSVRFELFRPIDEPIIFDRKNRKVYRIFREVIPGWKGLMRRWPLKSATYDWDLIDAEHHAAVSANTSTISRVHALVLIVRRRATDPTVEDSFTLGSGQLGEVTVPAVYEHIRMFMEENGPHIPLGETISSSPPPATIWQCLASVGPYGENFRTLWNHHKVWLTIIILFYPILFFFMTPVGIFAWLSYKTSVPIKWSQEVMEAVGSPRNSSSN
jgi:hypothetical protein